MIMDMLPELKDDNPEIDIIYFDVDGNEIPKPQTGSGIQYYVKFTILYSHGFLGQPVLIEYDMDVSGEYYSMLYIGKGYDIKIGGLYRMGSPQFQLLMSPDRNAIIAKITIIGGFLGHPMNLEFKLDPNIVDRLGSAVDLIQDYTLNPQNQPYAPAPLVA